MKYKTKLRPNALRWFRAMRSAEEFTELSGATLKAFEREIFAVPVLPTKQKRRTVPSNGGLSKTELRISSHKVPKKQAAREFLVRFDPLDLRRSIGLLTRWQKLFGTFYTEIPFSVRKQLLVYPGIHRSLSHRYADLKKLRAIDASLSGEETSLLALGYLVKQDASSLASLVDTSARVVVKNKRFLDYIVKDKFDFIEELAKYLILSNKFGPARKLLGYVVAKERPKYRDMIRYLATESQKSKTNAKTSFDQWLRLNDLEKETSLRDLFLKLREKPKSVEAQVLRCLRSIKNWAGEGNQKLRSYAFHLLVKNLSLLSQTEQGDAYLQDLSCLLFDDFYAELWEIFRFSKSEDLVSRYFKFLAKFHVLHKTPRFDPRDVISLYQSYESSISFQRLKGLFVTWTRWKRKLSLALKSSHLNAVNAERKIIALAVCDARNKIRSSDIQAFIGAFGFDPFRGEVKKPVLGGSRTSTKILSGLKQGSQQNLYERDRAWLAGGIRYFRDSAKNLEFQTTADFKPCYAKFDIEKAAEWMASGFSPKVQKLLSFWFKKANFRQVLTGVSSETMKAKNHGIFHGSIQLQKLGFHLASIGFFSRSDNISFSSEHKPPFVSELGEGAVLANFLWSLFGFDLLLVPSKIRFQPSQWAWLLGSQKAEELIINTRATAVRVNSTDLEKELKLFVLRLASVFHKHPSHLLACIAKSDINYCDLHAVAQLESWILSESYLSFRHKTGQSIKTPLP